MKKKLYKDFRFLKPLWVRVIISFILGISISLGNNGCGFEKLLFWIVALPTFIISYFFIAWLYGNEDVTNS